MKKEHKPAGFFSVPKLEPLKEHDTVNETVPYVQIQHEFAKIINLNSIATPFLVQPLDVNFNRFIKRVFDIILSLLFFFLIFSWLFPIIALAIKLNSLGPVFFLQKRNKRNGELFICIKFRSMYKNSDADILPARKNDNRITSTGRLLRKYYLDELPQFLNVLWGDMSVIGPRPHMVSDNVKFDGLIKNYSCRHNVKPGITGLAQVMGYVGAIDDLNKMKSRVNMDIFYSRHWSLKFDIIILYRTVCRSLGL